MERGNHDRSLLVTKLAIPPTYCRQFVPRMRLTDKLETTLFPLTLITAPAGFGKTTLVSAWLHQRELAAAWISLEGNDNDPEIFWGYMFKALQNLHPSLNEQMAELATAPPNSTEMLTSLINALSTLSHDVFLILDDYHAITTPAIHQALTFLLEHRPTHFHLIIVTRMIPPMPLARLRVRGQLSELNTNDLRFTLQESTAFLSEAMNLTLTTEDIAELHNLTGGWVAGLQLAALALQRQDDPATISSFIKTFSGTHRHVAHYLTEEVLTRLPDHIQHFLLTTSILDRLNPALCDAITEQNDGEATLEWLDQSGLFLTPEDHQHSWYHYDQLFCHHLRHCLQQSMPDLVPYLHQRAATWFEQHGFLVEAIHHAFASTDFEQATNLMERCARSLLARMGCDDYERALFMAEQATPLAPNNIRSIVSALANKEQPVEWDNQPEPGTALIEKLSEREQEVLTLIAGGLSNQEIAQRLVVTVSTIKTHLNNIYAKLNVHTRLQAVTKAYDLGLLRRNELETEPNVHWSVGT